MEIMMMSGKSNNDVTFRELFDTQTLFQNIIIEKGLYERFKNKETVSVPTDDVNLMSYHIQQLMSELGEVLNADKRWKSHRNVRYDRQEKLEEIADCFIVLMNIAMFSNFNSDEVVEAIKLKLNENVERIKN